MRTLAPLLPVSGQSSLGELVPTTMFEGRLAIAFLLCMSAPCWAAYSFVEPGFAGFDYSFDGFSTELTGGGVRVTDLADGAGGVGLGLGGVDLSDYSAGRFVAEFATLPDHTADQLLLELTDTNGATGQWPLLTTSAVAGAAQRVVARQTLNAPPSGSGVLDLSSIDRFQVLGNYSEATPIDIRFDSVAIENGQPEPSPYFGHAADAAWRFDAAARIDSLRKGDLVVRVFDGLGQRVKNAPIHFEQQSHAFGFGTAVRSWRLNDSSPENLVYQQHVRELFNVATLENTLKWPAWEGEWGERYSPAIAEAAIDWLEEEGIGVRGHAMLWPSGRWSPSDVRGVLDSGDLTPEQVTSLRQRVTDRIIEIGSAFAGRLETWDVINEPRRERELIDAFPEGDTIIQDWLVQARSIDSQAELFVNEFGPLISGGRVNTPEQRLLQERLEALQAAGAPLDGVGLQGHFREGELTGPEQLWRIFDRYEDLGLDIHVTEFDYETIDEQAQAEYLGDFFTAAFAHEGVSQINQWGFWEGEHWRPDGALFREDWSIKPAGQQYLDLVFGEWWTDEAVRTTGLGKAKVRGFQGEHTATIEWGDQEYSIDVKIGRGWQRADMTVPFLLGDFDGNGAVEIEDFRLWKATRGQTVERPGMGADGNFDGVVDDLDYRVYYRSRWLWKQRLAAAAIPEPGSGCLLLAAVTLLPQSRRSSQPARG